MSTQPDVNVNRFECSECGWVSYPPPHVTAGLFHPCRKAGKRERLKPTFGTDRESETAAWAQDRFGVLRDALADSVPADELLRRVEEDE